MWVDEGPARPGPGPAKRTRRRGPAVAVEAGEFVPLVGAKRASRLAERVEQAATAFAEERFPEARRLLRPVVEEAPGSVTARELLGLTHYRLGNWKEASRQLEALLELSPGSTEQHPVLADCYRALKRYGRVDELWEELREVSPSAALVTEGRIVVAGSLADRGRLRDAIALLAKGWKAPRRAAEHHLRRAYALADLYERAGEVPAARALFGWVVAQDAGYVDAPERLAGLG